MPTQLIKLAVILILLSSSLYAQIDSTKANQGVNINFFNGYAVSYKWNANRDISYRVYLDLASSLINSDNDQDYRENSSDYKQISKETIDEIYLDLNVSYQVLFNVLSKKSLNMYLGIGPNLNYSYSKWENSRNGANGTDYYKNKSTNNNNSYGVGIISLVGFEAYLTNSISLFAETHINGKMSWNTYDREYNHLNNNTDVGTTTTQDGSGWSANIQLVKVGLGIYF